MEPLGDLPILDRMRLDGRRGVVTGAGRGIGRGFAHALGEAGARVAVVDLELERAEAVVAELQGKGIEALAVGGDVSRSGVAEEYVERIVHAWGGLEIAVHNAGINLSAAAEDTTEADWDRTFEVNTRSVFLGCRAAARPMFKAGYGKIINTASMASLIVPHPQRQAAYNASKAAVVQLTRTLAAEWADRGIRVNCVSPGIIQTALIDGSAELRPLVEAWVSQIPAGRLGQVTDLQAAVVYLAGAPSDYMTGHNLAIEGGQTLW